LPLASTWQISPAPTRTALDDDAGIGVADSDVVAVAVDALGPRLSEGPAVAVAVSGTIATGVGDEEGVDDTSGDPRAASDVATSRIEVAAASRAIGRRFGFTAGSCQPAWASSTAGRSGQGCHRPADRL
jgi:hydrogenase maturation factor HypE